MRPVLCAAIAAALFSIPAATLPARTLPLTLPLISDGLLASIRGSIHGRPVQLDLDTGGTETIIDIGTVHRLGVPVAGPASIQGAGKGTIQAERLGRFAITFETATFFPKAALAIDYTKVGRPTHLDGLLGFDFFSRYVVAIDYDRRSVTLYDPTTYAYAGRGAKVPLTFKGPRMYVPVTARVAGAPAQRQYLRLDTGSEDELDDDIVLRSTGPKKPITSGVGIGSRFQAYVGTVDALQIGPYTLHDLTAATGGVPIVGNAILRRFKVVVDVRHAALYLEPRASVSS